MYCPKCRLAFEGERCPKCKKTRTSPPRPDDPCFLTEVAPVWNGMLKDVLDQNGIPALCESTMGAGMAMQAGSMFERFRFFVRYEDLPDASALVDALFRAPIEAEQPEESETPGQEG